MKKEKKSDKFIKRFYGITGPFDEYKRQTTDHIGNIAYMALYTTLWILVLISFILSSVFEVEMGLWFPIILAMILIFFGFFISYQLNKTPLPDNPIEEWTEEERQSPRHFVAISFTFSFVCMFLIYFLPDFIRQIKTEGWIYDSFWEFLISRPFLSSLIASLFFSLFMTTIAYFIRKSTLSDLKNKKED